MHKSPYNKLQVSTQLSKAFNSFWQFGGTVHVLEVQYMYYHNLSLN